MTITPVTSDRLRLPLWTVEEVAAIRGGARRPEWHPQFPTEDDLESAAAWREAGPWSSRSVELNGQVVGSIGFLGPPAPAEDGVPEVEIGYCLVGPVRGHGYATEAVTAIVAMAEAAGVRVRASVLPDNDASVRVLARCGFTSLRGVTEDGALVMVRPR